MRVPRDRSFLLFGLEEKEYSWRGVWLLILVYVGAIIFASIFSPFVYWGIQFWADTAPNRLNTYLAEKDFPRYFDRLRWLPVILLLPWLLKRCRLFSFQKLGFESIRNPGMGGRTLRWIVFGAGLILIAAAGQGMVLGLDTEPELTALKALQILLATLASALLIGVIEEAVFRGMILRMFYTALKPIPAVILSSLFFASVHFKKIPQEVWNDDSAAVTMGSGFFVGFWTLFSVVQTFEFVRFLNLFLFGTILCLLFLRTGSLWPCVGFHGGVVFARSLYGKYFNLETGSTNPFWGSGILLDGYFASILLFLICIWLTRGWIASKTTTDHEG